jgi:beta-galactosidase GanA
LTYTASDIDLPDLSTLAWKTIDDLPEIQSTYDDSLWTLADLNETFNSFQTQITPTSLFAGDYGYNAGVLVFRGHFTALGTESSFFVLTIGGSAFGSSVFLNNTYIGSWPGIDRDEDHNDTYTLPNLVAGSQYVFTILVDNNGLDENGEAGIDGMKTPRGILDFGLDTQPKTAISWKITGNLGGEQYVDKVRGPLNEGGLFAERQGFTQPFPPSDTWDDGSPLTGITAAGVAFYAAPFNLSLPAGFDIPLVFNFGNTTIGGVTADYRAQLWVNGYQFGKYTNNVGPQKAYPVPEGKSFLSPLLHCGNLSHTETPQTNGLPFPKPSIDSGPKVPQAH